MPPTIVGLLLLALPLGCSESADGERDEDADATTDASDSDSASDPVDDEVGGTDTEDVVPGDLDATADGDAEDIPVEPCNRLRDATGVEVQQATALDSCWVRPQGFEDRFETEGAWEDFLDSGLRCSTGIETLRLLEVDFAASDVYVVSRFLNETCSFSVQSAEVFLSEALTVLDIAWEDTSRGCQPVCTMGGGVLVAAVIPKSVALDVCIEWVGGCD